MLVPIREFIADVPAPGSDHRKHEAPTLPEQNLIDVRIAEDVPGFVELESGGPSPGAFRMVGHG
jgi:hypothetical protein